MKHDSPFNSAENQALLVVCARRIIRNAAIGGIVWGATNLRIGFAVIRINPINAAACSWAA